METGHEAPAGNELGRPVLFWEEAGVEWRCREAPGHGANPDEIALYRVGREGAEELVADTAVASDSVIDAVEAAWRGDAGVRLLYADLDAASMAADYGFGPLAADADPWVSRRCALVEPDGGDAFYVDVADPTDLYVSARDLLQEADRLCGPDGTLDSPWMGFGPGTRIEDVALALSAAFSPSADDPRGVEAAELLRGRDAWEPADGLVSAVASDHAWVRQNGDGTLTVAASLRCDPGHKGPGYHLAYRADVDLGAVDAASERRSAQRRGFKTAREYRALAGPKARACDRLMDLFIRDEIRPVAVGQDADGLAAAAREHLGRAQGRPRLGR